ncbi:transposase [Streptomyces sp. NPDC006476]|uniref:transposase n=1 Tax=Streptomyces sp. NPDC006476 TaxID=3157175 RepID=UPI0033B1707C
MGSRKRIYNAEFREGAVRIVTETGKPIPEVAEELGVHPGTLHSWVSRPSATARRRRTRPSRRRRGQARVAGCGRVSGLSWNGCGPRPGRRTSASASWRWA